MPKTKVGILGFGKLGQFLTDKIVKDPIISKSFELVFIQNRSKDKLPDQLNAFTPTQFWGPDIKTEFSTFLNKGNTVDLVVECSHPDIVKQNAELIVSHSDVMVTSLTAFAADDFRESIFSTDHLERHCIYVPTGAGWGFDDIRKMAELNQLRKATISMKFHYDSLKLNATLNKKLEEYVNSDLLTDLSLAKGPISQLASAAPNNTNTMCGLALACGIKGFNLLEGELIASKVSHTHEVVIDIHGENGYHVKTIRLNPAMSGAVTGSQTFYSFLGSLIRTLEKNGNGIQFV